MAEHKQAPQSPVDATEGLQKRIEDLAELVTQQQQIIEALAAEKGATGANAEPVINQIYDPFADHNAIKITGIIPADQRFPEGQTLTWMNPRFREREGYKGWTPLQYGDEYTGKEGEKLAEYGVTPPPRVPMSSGVLDSYVRLGDVILCRLDKRLVDQRRRNSIERGKARIAAAGSGATIPVGHSALEGPGLKTDPRPRRGFQRSMVVPAEPGTISRVKMPTPKE